MQHQSLLVAVVPQPTVGLCQSQKPWCTPLCQELLQERVWPLWWLSHPCQPRILLHLRGTPPWWQGRFCLRWWNSQILGLLCWLDPTIHAGCWLFHHQRDCQRTTLGSHHSCCSSVSWSGGWRLGYTLALPVDLPGWFFPERGAHPHQRSASMGPCRYLWDQ